ncbi:MAG: cation transporter [Chloroflexota bacterium]|nr:cation transporter [Chloroflexota bacterium]
MSPHHGGTGRQQRALVAVLALGGAVLVVQLVGGLLTNSLALLADAGHVFTDVAGIALGRAASITCNKLHLCLW